MKWARGYRSADVEDRRGDRPPRRYRGRIGMGGVLVVLALVAARYLFGIDVLSGGGTTSSSSQTSHTGTNEDPELVSFVSFVLDDAQKTWTELFAAEGKTYRRATLVLFTDATDTACGYGSSAIGPFYCPPDRKVYIDLGFYQALRDRFDAPGDFAQAYVIAHEIGHHVQNLRGVKKTSRDDNEHSVRVELQADCYAGVWAHGTARRDLLEKGDVEEGLNAAAAIGDDRLQKMARGRVQPETFTHGSSAQRVRWFKRGLDAGTIAACDTFAEPNP